MGKKRKIQYPDENMPYSKVKGICFNNLLLAYRKKSGMKEAYDIAVRFFRHEEVGEMLTKIIETPDIQYASNTNECEVTELSYRVVNEMWQEEFHVKLRRLAYDADSASPFGMDHDLRHMVFDTRIPERDFSWIIHDMSRLLSEYYYLSLYKYLNEKGVLNVGKDKNKLLSIRNQLINAGKFDMKLAYFD